MIETAKTPRTPRVPWRAWAVLAALLLVPRAACAEPDGSHIRALLIGINHYMYTGWPVLNGCRQDVENLRRILVDRFGAKADRITVLDEQLATKDGIEEALQQLVSAAQPGDTILFAYSGHGAQVPDRDPPPGAQHERRDEVNGLDECIIPIDAPNYKDPRFPDAVVRDDFMEDMLAALVAKTRSNGAPGSVVLVFDSCHSGGMSRAAQLAGDAVRTVPEADEYFRGQVQAAAARAPEAVMAAGHKAGGHGWVVLSACRSDEQAHDSQDGGAFSQTLLGALQDKRLTDTWTYTDLMQLVSTAPGLRQSPQSDGDRALRIFGGTAQPRKPGIAVTAVSLPQVFLDQGTLVGVTPGSRIALYPAGTHAPQGAKRIAEVEVDAVGTTPYRAAAHVVGDASGDLRNAVGWITRQSFSGSVLSVFLADDLPAVRALLEGDLKAVVRVAAQAKDADLIVYGSGPDGRQGAISVERPGGDAARSVVARVDAGDMPRLRETLEAEARRSLLTRMINEAESLGVALKTGHFRDKSDVHSFEADAQVARAGDGRVIAHAGREALLEITNRGTVPLYVSVLDLVPPDSHLEVLYPAPVEEANWKALPPGGTLQVDVGFEWPREAGGAATLPEGFKVLGTPEKVDLQFLCTRGSRSATPEPRKTLETPLGQLLSLVVGGTRAGRPVLHAEPKSYVGLPVLWVRLEPR